MIIDESVRRQMEIDEVLRLIGKAWKTCPELRLSQLIINAVARESSVPLFYSEDLTTAHCVELYCKKIVVKEETRPTQ